MILRRSTTVKYSIAAFLGAALYCEWFVYRVQPWFWPDLECSDYDASCTRILFVADPQIQGDVAVPPPLSYLYNWDSDRYLRMTFQTVINHFKPDVLVYLGDLMDEGSISTLQQFHGYVKRLSDIFKVNYPVVQVWVPGDNDIGGENEPVKRDKVIEFDKVFEQPPVIGFRNISFYKVNGITHSYPTQSLVGEGNLRIVVSHYPITKNYVFGEQVMKVINPNIFFCAHDHESKYVKQSKDLKNRVTSPLVVPKTVLSISLDDDDIYEVYVPTCSYRMGTSYIGYGAAILENNNNHMRYAVFWSSTRFPYLILYLVILALFLIYCLVFCVAKLLHRQPTAFRKSGDLAPLLTQL